MLIDFRQSTGGGGGSSSSLKIKDTGIKFGSSAFSTIPESIDFEGVTDMSNMFRGNVNLTKFDRTNLGKVNNMEAAFDYCSQLSEIAPIDTSECENFNFAFRNCPLVNMPELDMNKATSLNECFATTQIADFPASLFTFSNTNGVDLRGAFSGNTAMKAVPNMNWEKVTSLKNAFYNCKGLTGVVDLPNTSNCTDFYGMFSGCSGLTEIKSLNTSNAKSMDSIFNGCTSLQKICELDYSNVDINERNMPFSWGRIETLTDLGGFKNVKNELIIKGCHNLTKQSMLNVLNDLYDWTANPEGLEKVPNADVYFYTGLNGLLTEEEAAIAANKGWTINYMN